MFGVNKEKLIKSLCRLSASLCSYTKQPCDCKYIDDSITTIATRSEKGSGCPETTLAALLIAHMTRQEFDTIAHRAGIEIGDEAFKAPDVLGMISKFQEEKQIKRICSGIPKRRNNKAIGAK